MKKSALPTRKWIAAQVLALAAVATSWVDSGWDDTETKLLIGIAVQAAVTYLLPNEDTPGGVPLKTRTRKRRESGQSVVGVVIVLLVAALVYWLCVALGLPWIVAVIAAIVLVAGFGGASRF